MALTQRPALNGAGCQISRFLPVTNITYFWKCIPIFWLPCKRRKNLQENHSHQPAPKRNVNQMLQWPFNENISCEQVYCSSSGGTILYIQQLVYVVLKLMELYLNVCTMSVPNKQRKYTNIRTSKRNCIRPKQQCGITKHADTNS